MDQPSDNPKVNFYQDLCKLIQDCQHHDPHCIHIIKGDWNESCQGSSTSAKLCQKFELVDAWSHTHPNTEFRSHQQGSSCIDSVLTLPWLAQHMHMIYKQFSHRLRGNHQGLYLDIPKSILFGNTQNPIFPQQSRRL